MQLRERTKLKQVEEYCEVGGDDEVKQGVVVGGWRKQ